MKAQAGKALPSQEGAPEGDNFDKSFLTVRQPPTSDQDTLGFNFRGLDGCGGLRPLPDSPSKLKFPPTLDHSGGHPFLSSLFSGPKMSVPMEHRGHDSGIQLGLAVSLFSMGSAFPFSALPSPPPSRPPPSPPPSAPYHDPAQHTMEGTASAFQLGQTFPFANSNLVVETSNSKSFESWVKAHGGYSGCKGWLAHLFQRDHGTNWKHTSTEELMEWLALHPRLGQGVDNSILTPTDSVTLQNLISEAKLSNSHTKGRGSKRRYLTLSLPDSLSRCQKRNATKRLLRALDRKSKQKQKKRRACRLAFSNYTKPKKGTFTIGSWNTRGLGAPFGKDPAGKEHAIGRFMSERNWNAALLTDLRYKEDGFRTLSVGNVSWLLIHFGRVGVALDPFLTQQWKQGGSKILKGKGEDIQNRFFGVVIPSSGWKPGLCLIPVYAPLTNKTSLQFRDAFRDQLSRILDVANNRLKPILGGDFNGEVGATKDRGWRHVLGPFGDHRRTRGGEELLHFCEVEGLIVTNSFSPQENKGTWFHPKDGTAHCLDHFLVRKLDKRWVRSVKTIHFEQRSRGANAPRMGRQGKWNIASWLEYTDHDPIELVWVAGKDWKTEAERRNHHKPRPDVIRLLGSSTEAKSLREQYARRVTSNLEQVEGKVVDWDTVADIIYSAALQVVGPTPPRNPRPWLQGKESELRDLETSVHQVELELRQARVDNSTRVPDLLEARRQASNLLGAKKKQWEAQWWDQLADKAEAAGQTGNEFDFWRLLGIQALPNTYPEESLVTRNSIGKHGNPSSHKFRLMKVRLTRMFGNMSNRSTRTLTPS